MPLCQLFGCLAGVSGLAQLLPMFSPHPSMRPCAAVAARFEVPFNIWCNQCGEHIAKGVRFNAEKKQVGGLALAAAQA